MSKRTHKVSSVQVVEMLQLVRECRLSYEEIGKRYGLTKEGVAYWAKAAGIPRTAILNHRIDRRPAVLTVSDLQKWVYYDKDVGVFTSRKTGRVMGWTDPYGYIQIGIHNRKRYLAHRLAWFYVRGRWPEKNLDHINGNPSDNRIANLRECNQSQNSANSKLVHATSSIRKGVCYDPGRKKFRAYIRKNGKQHHIGRFDTLDEALAARVEAEQRLHGDFARRA